VAISYTVVPTAASLSDLTSQYVSGSGAPNANGVIHDLKNKLLHDHICQYIAKVNDAAAAPTPSLTTTQAAELIYWARILNPNC
jgi:hypothetical protein